MVRPIHFRQSVLVCSIDGDPLEVLFDVTVYGHFRGETTMRGKLIVDGAEYVSIHDLYENASDSTDSHYFQIPAENALEGTQNTIILNLYDDSFEAFSMLLRKEQELYCYYGQASSQEEAYEVWTEYGELKEE